MIDRTDTLDNAWLALSELQDTAIAAFSEWRAQHVDASRDDTMNEMVTLTYGLARDEAMIARLMPLALVPDFFTYDGGGIDRTYGASVKGALACAIADHLIRFVDQATAQAV